MKKSGLIAIFLIFFLGCAAKSINVYIPYSKNKTVSNIKVVDKRKNPQIIGVINSKNRKVGDITFSSDLKEIIRNRLYQKGIKNNLEIEVNTLFIRYDKSKLTGENAYASFSLKIKFYKNGLKATKIIKVNQSRWLNPLNSSKELENFSQKVINEAVNLIIKALNE